MTAVFFSRALLHRSNADVSRARFESRRKAPSARIRSRPSDFLNVGVPTFIAVSARGRSLADTCSALAVDAVARAAVSGVLGSDSSGCVMLVASKQKSIRSCQYRLK